MPASRSLVRQELVLEGVQVWKRDEGRWTLHTDTWVIRHPLEKLRAKYAQGGSLIHDHYVFGLRHREPNRVTPVDAWAIDRLMSGRITANWRRREHVLRTGASKSLANILKRIPLEASLDQPTWDDTIVSAIKKVVQPQVGISIATKLLSVKRPWLVPMLDSVVQGLLGEYSDVRKMLTAMRSHLQNNRQVIEHLRRAIGNEIGLKISPLRILDQLMWFDCNYESEARRDGTWRIQGFDAWGYDPRHHDQGVRLVD